MSAAAEDMKFAGEAIWKILIAAVILGAGLPVLFATGIRSLAWGLGSAEVPMEDGRTHRPNPLGTVLAIALFAIVLYGIAAGIVYVIATGKGSGYDIGFDNLIPVIVKTK